MVNPAGWHSGSCGCDGEEPVGPLPGGAWGGDRAPPTGTGGAFSAGRGFVLGEQPDPVPHIL